MKTPISFRRLSSSSRPPVAKFRRARPRQIPRAGARTPSAPPPRAHPPADTRTADRRRRAQIALTLVGLADRRSHRPNELSGGQQQRVAIARAIVSDPTFLICDEPTGDLDRHSAQEILDLLQMLNREHGKTIIMVTHDPKAAGYATHTIHLDKGELADAPTAH